MVDLDQHDRWNRTKGMGGKLLILRGEIFRNVRYDHRLFTNIVIEDADFTGAILTGSDFTGAVLSRTKFTDCKLSKCTFKGAMLDDVDFSSADLSFANLSGASARYANFTNATVFSVSLSGADLSGAIGFVGPSEWVRENLESTPDGVIAYKAFTWYARDGVRVRRGLSGTVLPSRWEIKPGAILDEIVDRNPQGECGCGVHIATKSWILTKTQDPGLDRAFEIWKVLIEWPWLPGLVVPHGTDGKCRAKRIRLLEVVDIVDRYNVMSLPIASAEATAKEVPQ